MPFRIVGERTAGKIMCVFSAIALFAFTSPALTLRGTVTNVNNDQSVVGAIVSFAGGANIYTDTTITGGTFELLNVKQTTGQLTVTASGYQTSRQFLTNLTTVDTVAVALTPTGGIMTGIRKIAGLVTDSSGNAISGASLVLSQISTGVGGIATPIDTVVSAGDGKYAFDSLPAARYDLSVSKTGFLDNTSNTNLNLTTADSLSVNVTLASIGNRVGTLNGTVTATDTALPVVNAKILLVKTTTGVGGVITTETIDSTFSNGSGVYSMARIPDASGYMLYVSATGYDSASSPNAFTVDSGITRTENFALQAIIPPSGIIRGSVIDSSSLAAISGVNVVLRKQQPNLTWLAIDSMNSAQDGSFTFTGQAIGTYSLVASDPDFKTYTTPVNHSINLTTNPDTATIEVTLAAVAKGNLVVFVQDQTQAPVSGASVSAVQVLSSGTGKTYSGTTSAGGWITFTNAIAGTYDLTVMKTGFNTATKAGLAVTSSVNDTSTISLTTATGASKVVQGTVISTVSGAVGSAVVVLKAQVNSGTVLTLVDTCNSKGAYTITGIPAGYTTMSLTVTHGGYVTLDTANIPIANDTTTVNISLTPVPTSSADLSLNRMQAGLAVTATRGGIYVQTGMLDMPVHITLYSLQGRIVVDKILPAGTSSYRIARVWSNQTMLLQAQQGTRVIRQRVIME